MRATLRRIFLAVQLILVPLFISIVFADPPGPPPPPTPVNGNPVVGGNTGAPIGDGGSILLVLGIAFGCYKLYEIRKKKDIEKEEPF
jgi:hypothetical protein